MVARDQIELTIAKGMFDEIETSIEIFEPVIAPTPIDQPIGKLTMKLEGQVIAESNLYPRKKWMKIIFGDGYMILHCFFLNDLKI